jgi:hypothetical protein
VSLRFASFEGAGQFLGLRIRHLNVFKIFPAAFAITISNFSPAPSIVEKCACLKTCMSTCHARYGSIKWD